MVTQDFTLAQFINAKRLALYIVLVDYLFVNPCITAYGLSSLSDNSKYVVALSFIFKACTKSYVVNSCLAPLLNPDNEQ